MARTAALVATAIVGTLFGAAAAPARDFGPRRYSPGPASPSLSKLVGATGNSASDAADARFSYLRKLDSQSQTLATASLNGANVPAAASQQGVSASRQGRVLVDVYVNGIPGDAAKALAGLGMQVTGTSDHAPEPVVEGWLPAAALTKVAGLAQTRAIAAVPANGVNAGGTLSQGDAAHLDPAARALGTTGAGVKVGVISNSINRVGGGIADSQGTGDLPPSVSVLQDGPAGSSDEGRAMAEIIYDEAPGITNMYFTTGTSGPVAKAAGIANLVAQGVKVIADDSFLIDEPFFQDGIVSQAVDAAKAAGVSYLVSAGNRARQSWEGTYAPTTDPRGVSPSTEDFNPGSAADPIQTLGTFTNRKVFVELQWDEPFGHVTTNLALDLYDLSGGTPTYFATVDGDNIASGLPEERANITVPGTSTIGIAIRRVAGTRNPFMKYIVGGTQPFSIGQYPTNSGAIDPDAASARGALTVAASNYATPTTPETFSSRGPVRRLFDAAGNRLAAPDVRLKPNLDAADHVATSVPGFSAFSGTSAAAPSAAGIATLVRSARPSLTVDQVASIMTSPVNTLDCTASPGKPDFDCGYGFILANKAVAMARDATPPVITPILSPAAPTGRGGYYTGNVAVRWSVADPNSPISALAGCAATTVSTDGRRTLSCSATSIGGTATRSVLVKRDRSAPKKPRFTGIKAKTYKRSKLPKKSKVKCKSSDPTSHVAKCKVSGYSKKLGKHKLTARATNGAGLSSKRTITYKVVR